MQHFIEESKKKLLTREVRSYGIFIKKSCIDKNEKLQQMTWYIEKNDFIGTAFNDKKTALDFHSFLISEKVICYRDFY